MLSFKNGKPGGIHRGYYPDGSLEYEGSRKNGEIHGKYIKYYFGGQTEMTGQFKRGIYNGKWKYYDVNGNLSMEKKYIRGSLIDSIIYWWKEYLLRLLYLLISCTKWENQIITIDTHMILM